MKILLIAKPWRGGLGRYFFLALEDMFPGQVEWLSTRPQSLAERRQFRRDPQGWWKVLLDKIETTPCDAAFFISHREEFTALKPRSNYVLYVVDDVRMTREEAAPFGRIFLSDPGYESDLKKIVSPEQYGGVLPFACYPPLHKPAAKASAQKDICFVGNRDRKRDPYIARLLEQGFKALIVGNYFLKSPLFWRHPFAFRPAVKNDAMGGIYAGSKISLNIHAAVVREGTNMRSFECAGYGIPQIVEYRPGIEKYFTPDSEILTYKNADEMAAKARSLLDNPERARKMAAAAQRRAQAEHTYYHRIAAALGHLIPTPMMEQALTGAKEAA